MPDHTSSWPHTVELGHELARALQAVREYGGVLYDWQFYALQAWESEHGFPGPEPLDNDGEVSGE